MKKLKLSTAIAAIAWATISTSQVVHAGEINIIMEEVPDYDIVAKLTDQFTEQNPGITVNFDAMPFDAMRDKILTSSLAPSATYDVIIIDNPWTDEFARAGFLEPLDSLISSQDGYAYDDFVPALADISKVDGSIYGVHIITMLLV